MEQTTTSATARRPFFLEGAWVQAQLREGKMPSSAMMKLTHR